MDPGTSLVVQWLKLCPSIAGCLGLIPGWGIKILHVVWQKKKKTIPLKTESNPSNASVWGNIKIIINN